MSTKFQNLRNDLNDLENSDQLDIDATSGNARSSGHSNKISSYILLFAFLATLVFYVGSRATLPEINSPIDFIEELNQPSQSLLEGMGTWMEDMGYGELTDDELIALRSEGVTATYTSEIRDIGYTEVTLDQLVELQRADVSADFTRMMKELGYVLSIDDLITLRRNNVTAHFTSNMLDLGYTMEELTTENLIRMRSVGVTHQQAGRMMEENGGVKPSIDELIRYRISNQ